MSNDSRHRRRGAAPRPRDSGAHVDQRAGPGLVARRGAVRARDAGEPGRGAAARRQGRLARAQRDGRRAHRVDVRRARTQGRRASCATSPACPCSRSCPTAPTVPTTRRSSTTSTAARWSPVAVRRVGSWDRRPRRAPGCTRSRSTTAWPPTTRTPPRSTTASRCTARCSSGGPAYADRRRRRFGRRQPRRPR